MNFKLVIEPAAEKDILVEYRWYEDRRVGLGLKFLDALDALFERILENPLLYVEVIPDVRRSVSRTFPYLIFYTCESESIHILGVIHAAQNPNYITERLGN